MDIIDNEKSYEEKDSNPVQESDIIEEMRKLEQLMHDPNVYSYKKSTLLNQSNKSAYDEKSEILLKEIIDRLIKIELKLTDIENLIKKMKHKIN